MTMQQRKERRRENRRKKRQAEHESRMAELEVQREEYRTRNCEREDYIGYRNNELYADPTAYAALNNVIRESRSRRYNASF